MNSKDKENLSYLYELDVYKSFVKLCNQKRLRTAEEILKVDMSTPGAIPRIAMLQGQYGALQFIQLEIQKIHKGQTKES